MKPKVLEAYLKHDSDCTCLLGGPCNCGLHEAIKASQDKLYATRVALAKLLQAIDKALKVISK